MQELESRMDAVLKSEEQINLGLAPESKKPKIIK